MQNQHQKIKGYRDLSQEEVDLMNEVKALGPQIKTVIDKVTAHVKTQRDSCCIIEQFKEITNQDEYDRLNQANPEKFIQLATDDFQIALMLLTRAIAQPTTF
ncbi:DUF7681 family protein [Acinetobacter baumannii]|uniref:Acb2/Tad1 domain-containing protein n=1 Tax=Acinetobacter baumannii TaxID=470 RepID=UPI003B2EEF67